MAKKQNFYYVMVMTDNGPAFVTEVDRINKVAMWNKTEKPLELSKYWAEDLTLGLNLNWHLAYTICSKFELENQPYLYDKGGFTWQSKETANEDKTKENEKTA